MNTNTSSGESEPPDENEAAPLAGNAARNEVTTTSRRNTSDAQAVIFESVALLPVEAERLTQLERVVERGLATWVEVTTALVEIRDSKLYRATHRKFESYCRERWGISRARAYEFINAGKVIAILSGVPDTPLPSNVRQTEELAGLEPAQQREVWSAAVETVPNGKPTAADVKRARSKLYPAPQRIIDIEATATVIITASASGTVTYWPIVESPKRRPSVRQLEGKPATQIEVGLLFEDTWLDKWTKFRDDYLGDFHSENRGQVLQLIREWMAGLPPIRALVEASL
jgi:hypothetical protein